jgi:hypothetical protein
MFTLLTTDEISAIRNELQACEAEITKLRLRQSVLLQRLEHDYVDRIEGARSLDEWAAAELNIEPSRARTLVETIRSVGRHR